MQGNPKRGAGIRQPCGGVSWAVWQKKTVQGQNAKARIVQHDHYAQAVDAAAHGNGHGGALCMGGVHGFVHSLVGVAVGGEAADAAHKGWRERRRRGMTEGTLADKGPSCQKRTTESDSGTAASADGGGQ